MIPIAKEVNKRRGKRNTSTHPVRARARSLAYFSLLYPLKYTHKTQVMHRGFASSIAIDKSFFRTRVC